MKSRKISTLTSLLSILFDRESRGFDESDMIKLVKEKLKKLL